MHFNYVSISKMQPIKNERGLSDQEVLDILNSENARDCATPNVQRIMLKMSENHEPESEWDAPVLIHPANQNEDREAATFLRFMAYILAGVVMIALTGAFNWYSSSVPTSTPSNRMSKRDEMLAVGMNPDDLRSTERDIELEARKLDLILENKGLIEKQMKEMQ